MTSVTCHVGFVHFSSNSVMYVHHCYSLYIIIAVQLVINFVLYVNVKYYSF